MPLNVAAKRPTESAPDGGTRVSRLPLAIRVAAASSPSRRRSNRRTSMYTTKPIRNRPMKPMRISSSGGYGFIWNNGPISSTHGVLAMPANTRIESPPLPSAITVSPSLMRRRWSSSTSAWSCRVRCMSKPKPFSSFSAARRLGCSFTGTRTNSSINRKIVARASCSLICSTSPVSTNCSDSLTNRKTLAACGPVCSTTTCPRNMRLRSLLSRWVSLTDCSCSGMPSKRSHVVIARMRSMAIMGLRLSAISEKVPWARCSRY